MMERLIPLVYLPIFFDGAGKLWGFKDGEMLNFSERAGAVASVALPAVLLYSRFVVKPKMTAVLGEERANSVIASIPLGKLTFG